MTIHRYVTKTYVVRIEERFEAKVSGFGAQSTTEVISTGWWVVTAPPNPMALQAGPEIPSFKVGAEVNIILEVADPL